MANRLLLALFLCCLNSISYAAIIDSTPFWDGNHVYCCVGEIGSGEATMGQSFVTPKEDTVLAGFSFWVDYRNGPGAALYSAYIMKWDSGNRHVTGPILYESSTQEAVPDGGIGDRNPIEVFFDTGLLKLEAGETYIAFLSASEYYDGQVDAIMLGRLTVSSYVDDPIPGGGIYRISNGADFDLLSQSDWSGPSTEHLAFRAEFSSQVPEPATIWLLVTSRPCKTHFSVSRLTRVRATPAAAGQGWRAPQS